MNMVARSFAAFALIILLNTAVAAERPATKLYPFKESLETIRAVSQGEKIPNSEELKEAWDVYRILQGSWEKKADGITAEAKKAATERLDALKKKLEARPQPAWFKSALEEERMTVQTSDKVGDELFEKQKETPEAQALKALALVYLTEHELDRPGSAFKALTYLRGLLVTQPWDWTINALYARMLADAGQMDPAWAITCQSIFLNPNPDVEDFKFFAFMGRVTEKGDWEEIQKAIRAAAKDPKVASQAIEETRKMFGPDGRVKVTPGAREK